MPRTNGYEARRRSDLVAATGNITSTCEDPRALAEFWAATIDNEI